MSKLYLYNYNNYFNRIFKKEDSLANYGTPIYTLSVTNFNYNDGVDTSHIVNYNGQDGDYLIITDDNDTIQSRWFVTENVRTRGGQHSLTLKRDLKVDFYELYKDAPMIVHRGWLRYNSPLLFNSEGFSYNQIKKEEILLKDTSKTPWYVVYFAKNAPTKTASFTTGETKPVYKVLNTTIAESIYGQGPIEVFSNQKYIINAQKYPHEPISTPTVKASIQTGGLGQGTVGIYIYNAGKDNSIIWFNNDMNTIYPTLESKFFGKYNTIKSLDTEHSSTTYTDEELQELLNSNGQYIKDSLNNIYYVEVVKSTITSPEEYTLNSSVTNYLKAQINETSLDREGNWGDKAFGITYDKDTYIITYTLDTSDTISWSVDFTSKQNTDEIGYNIIAFPADTVYITGEGGDNIMSKDISQKFLNSLLGEYGVNTSGGGFIYDIQLLPYCPLQSAIWEEDNPLGYLINKDIENDGRILDKEIYYNIPSPNTNRVELIFYYIKNATFEFNINQAISIDEYSPDITDNISIRYKINNECNLFRLCSPNYNGQFEFSVVKNYGVNYFNVDVTLRPYNPYIHVNPNFKGIYGADFNDSRGLICQGDFSIPLVTDQFKNYELQNKNYLNIFNRQIENMDFNFEQERVKGLFGAITGTLTGGIAGGVVGGKTGGIAGAATGSLIGGVASGIGGAIDYSMLTARQEEQRDFVVDNFNFKLGNIKALPYSLTKVTPFTANNKIYPFIEKYSATDEEKRILANRCYYNSFTIENIGTISEHIINRDTGSNTVKRFFSATLIINELFEGPTHELQELAKELERGVYI